MDVSIYELDCQPLIVKDNPGGVFEALKDPERFKQVRGEYTLIWPNPETGAYDERAIDIAPECVRFFCERYGKPVKTFAKGKTAAPARELRAQTPRHGG